MQRLRPRGLGIDTFLRIAAGVLVLLVAGFALTTLISQFSIDGLVKETRSTVLPQLLDDQRLAVDLERLVVEGERVRSATKATERRQFSLAARVLAHDAKTFGNPKIRRVVVASARQMHTMARLLNQEEDLRQDAVRTLARAAAMSDARWLLATPENLQMLAFPTTEGLNTIIASAAVAAPLSEGAQRLFRRAVALTEAAELRRSAADEIWTEMSITLSLLRDQLVTQSELDALDQLDRVRTETSRASIVLTTGFGIVVFLALMFVAISQRLISLPLRNAVKALGLDLDDSLASVAPQASAVGKPLREIQTIERAAQRMFELNAALKESERQVRLALEGGNHGLWDFNIQQGTVTVSPYLAAMLGRDATDWPHSIEDLDNLIHPDEYGRAHDDFLRHLAGDTPIYENVHRVRTLDGTWLWVRDRGQVVERADDGTPLRAVGTYTDVSDQVRMETELRRSNEELEQFAYIASHDLKEPLRMISSYLGLLRHRYRTKIDADADQFIDFASDGAQRMATMIEDLLSYSRVHSNGAPLEVVPAGRALDKALTNLNSLITETNAVLHIDELPQVMADEAQLSRLFQNLVANALKYRSPDRMPEITISARSQNGECEIRVADNGIGIDPAYHQRIFQIFARLKPRQATDGSGIGLAVCKRIVARHGGTLRVESQGDPGAAFIFTLPAPIAVAA